MEVEIYDCLVTCEECGTLHEFKLPSIKRKFFCKKCTPGKFKRFLKKYQIKSIS